MGGKTARNNFSRNTRIVLSKNVGKKSSEKSAKNVFLYSHEYRDEKMGGTKRPKQFFQKHTNSASKKCWEKNCRKTLRKTFFYIHTNIVTKKWGEQNARNNFSRNTRIVRAKNVGEEIVGKKCEKRFFIFTRNRDQKMGRGKKARQTIFPVTQE